MGATLTLIMFGLLPPTPSEQCQRVNAPPLPCHSDEDGPFVRSCDPTFNIIRETLRFSTKVIGLDSRHHRDLHYNRRQPEVELLTLAHEIQVSGYYFILHKYSASIHVRLILQSVFELG